MGRERESESKRFVTIRFKILCCFRVTHILFYMLDIRGLNWARIWEKIQTDWKTNETLFQAKVFEFIGHLVK